MNCHFKFIFFHPISFLRVDVCHWYVLLLLDFDFFGPVGSIYMQWGIYFFLISGFFGFFYGVNDPKLDVKSYNKRNIQRIKGLWEGGWGLFSIQRCLFSYDDLFALYLIHSCTFSLIPHVLSQIRYDIVVG